MAQQTISGQGSKSQVRACGLAELEQKGVMVVSTEDRSVAVFHDAGRVFAVDNRCPHMGFPLSRGTVRDGILTCHWHHARFDLAGGCTFDPFADDVVSFRVEVRDGEVWLDPTPIEEDRESHWLRKVTEGLEQDIPLVLAKSAVGLDGTDAANEVLRSAALFGTHNRSAGWSTGLSILTSLANVMDLLEPADRPRALFHGLLHVARSTAGQPADFDLAPLSTSESTAERYVDWFRRFAEVRSGEACERALRTGIAKGLSQDAVANLVFAACTDHLFLDTGHTLDFANKAFELVDQIGWEHAGDILPSLVPVIIGSQRMEETSSWRHPVDLPEILRPVLADIEDLVREGEGQTKKGWSGHRQLAEQILDGDPADTVDSLVRHLREGVPPTELSAAVAYAASRRLVHFRVTNEFGDWDTVHHVFTYTNAVDCALRRAGPNFAARGIFDGAMAVYLERFLNVPKQPIPTPSGNAPSSADLLTTFDQQGQVDRTGQIVSDFLAEGRHSEVVGVLGHALLREDSGFHSFQVYEAGLRQYRNFAGKPEGDHILVGVARFLSAHSPTVRSREQTFDIASRLHRGESLADE